VRQLLGAIYLALCILAPTQHDYIRLHLSPNASRLRRSGGLSARCWLRPWYQCPKEFST
jgi:hypothetical protein